MNNEKLQQEIREMLEKKKQEALNSNQIKKNPKDGEYARRKAQEVIDKTADVIDGGKDMEFMKEGAKAAMGWLYVLLMLAKLGPKPKLNLNKHNIPKFKMPKMGKQGPFDDSITHVNDLANALGYSPSSSLEKAQVQDINNNLGSEQINSIMNEFFNYLQDEVMDIDIALVTRLKQEYNIYYDKNPQGTSIDFIVDGIQKSYHAGHISDDTYNELANSPEEIIEAVYLLIHKVIFNGVDDKKNEQYANERLFDILHNNDANIQNELPKLMDLVQKLSQGIAKQNIKKQVNHEPQTYKGIKR